MSMALRILCTIGTQSIAGSMYLALRHLSKRVHPGLVYHLYTKIPQSRYTGSLTALSTWFSCVPFVYQNPANPLWNLFYAASNFTDFYPEAVVFRADFTLMVHKWMSWYICVPSPFWALVHKWYTKTIFRAFSSIIFVNWYSLYNNKKPFKSFDLNGFLWYQF